MSLSPGGAFRMHYNNGSFGVPLTPPLAVLCESLALPQHPVVLLVRPTVAVLPSLTCSASIISLQLW